MKKTSFPKHISFISFLFLAAITPIGPVSCCCFSKRNCLEEENLLISEKLKIAEKEITRLNEAYQTAESRAQKALSMLKTPSKNQNDNAGKTILLPAQIIPLDMVFVEKGSFTMSRKDGDNYEDEVSHTATLKNNFYIGRTEVTQEQYQAVMGKNPSPEVIAPRMPVVQVSWVDAMTFCDKLNDAGLAPEGWRFTLPTETQWEYAASGGENGHGFKFSGSNDLDEVGWYTENSDGSMHFVGQKKPNELGICDMNGNVWEWCLDDHKGSSRNATPELNRKNESGGARRVVRGGSWDYVPRFCRNAIRDSHSAEYRDNYLGFRVVIVPAQ